MEAIVVVALMLVSIVLFKFIFKIDFKKIEPLKENKELEELTDKFPENVQVAKEMLEMLGNSKVKIEEAKNTQTSLYIAVTDKISIADMKNNYARIQTIAHECLHSVQDRRLLLFNFIFSNIYLLYFLVVAILAIFKVLLNEMLFIAIFLALSCVYITVRTYLENDAMIKARFLAKEYMEEKRISSKEEIEKLVKGFDEINKVGIKCVNYYFFMEVMMKLFVLCTICLIR